jgi:hypothetical protein
MSEEIEEAPVDQDVAESLAGLRDVTMLTGAIHEAQIIQLQVWPKILFPCEKHTLEHDSAKRLLTITMQLSRDLTKEESTVHAATLERWCKELLGGDWALTLKAKSEGTRTKTVHKGVLAPEKPMTNVMSTLEFRRYRAPNQEAAAKAVRDDILLPLGIK